MAVNLTRPVGTVVSDNNPVDKAFLRQLLTDVISGVNGIDPLLTPSYVSRAAAVTAAPALPTSVTQILVREGSALVVRSRTASADDPLFAEGSRWGVVQRQDFTTALVGAGATRLNQDAGSTGDALVMSTATGAAVTTGALVRWTQPATNAAANPLSTIGGVNRFVQDVNGSEIPAGGLVSGRTYIGFIQSSGVIRLVTSGTALADVRALQSGLTAEQAKWTDRSVAIEAETPSGYTVPASTTTIVTRGGSYVDYWMRSGQQSNPVADGRVLTANNGYWIRVARLPKSELMQPIINAIQEVTGPSHWTFTDALGRVGGAIDLAGGMHLPDLNGLSVQDHIHRLYARHDARVDEARKSDRVNLVTEFGADPTGQQDCTSAFNRAYLALSAATSGPKTIYLPPGRYRLNDRVTPRSGVALIGAGMFESTVVPMSFRAAFDWRVGTTYLEECIFADFGIDAINQQLLNGSYTVQSKGFYFQRFRRCVFTRLFIRDTGATSIGIDYAEDSLIANNLVLRGGRLAAYGQPGASGIGIGTGKAQSEPLLILNNIVMDAKNYNIFLEQQGATNEDYAARNNVVAGNICIGGTHSFGDCGADGTLVTGNQFADAIAAAVILHGATVGAARPSSRMLLADNQIMRAGGAGVEWHGASWSGRGYHSHGNRIEQCAKGHWLRGSGQTVLDDFEIDDNIRDCTGHAVHFASGVFHNVDIAGRMINNGGVAIRLDATMRGGSIAARIRDLRAQPTQTDSIAGGGLITDFMVNGCQGVGCAPAALTNPGNQIAWGFNPGVTPA